jgi:hypothetical protein
MGDYLSGTKSKVILSLSTQTKQMKKYEQLESQIQELQKEVERLKQEEKAEQIDLSTCIAGQLVQLRNGKFEYYEYRNAAGSYIVGGDYYGQDGRCFPSLSLSQHDVVKVFPAEIPVPDSFSKIWSKEFLKGDVYSLIASFPFKETPQGEQYWRDIFTGKTKLSLGDMILIQKWVIQSL